MDHEPLSQHGFSLYHLHGYKLVTSIDNYLQSIWKLSVCSYTSDNAWHYGASVSEKLSVIFNIIIYIHIRKTIHEQIEFCAEHNIQILVYLLAEVP